jgi:hypothetical protein
MVCALSPAADNFEENLSTLVKLFNLIYFYNKIINKRDMLTKLKK